MRIKILSGLSGLEGQSFDISDSKVKPIITPVTGKKVKPFITPIDFELLDLVGAPTPQPVVQPEVKPTVTPATPVVPEVLTSRPNKKRVRINPISSSDLPGFILPSGEEATDPEGFLEDIHIGILGGLGLIKDMSQEDLDKALEQDEDFLMKVSLKALDDGLIRTETNQDFQALDTPQSRRLIEEKLIASFNVISKGSKINVELKQGKGLNSKFRTFSFSPDEFKNRGFKLSKVLIRSNEIGISDIAPGSPLKLISSEDFQGKKGFPEKPTGLGGLRPTGGLDPSGGLDPGLISLVKEFGKEKVSEALKQVDKLKELKLSISVSRLRRIIQKKIPKIKGLMSGVIDQNFEDMIDAVVSDIKKGEVKNNPIAFLDALIDEVGGEIELFKEGLEAVEGKSDEVLEKDIIGDLELVLKELKEKRRVFKIFGGFKFEEGSDA